MRLWMFDQDQVPVACSGLWCKVYPVFKTSSLAFTHGLRRHRGLIGSMAGKPVEEAKISDQTQEMSNMYGILYIWGQSELCFKDSTRRIDPYRLQSSVVVETSKEASALCKA